VSEEEEESPAPEEGSAPLLDRLDFGSPSDLDFGPPIHQTPLVPRLQFERREATRERIAYILLALLGTVVAFAWIGLLARLVNPSDVRDLLCATLTPLVGLAGAVTGFYYAEHRR
jgi:hypothetical protein